MPTWKKVIVSGSNAHLTSITASQVPQISDASAGGRVLAYDVNTGAFGYINTSSIVTAAAAGVNSFSTINVGGSGGSSGTAQADSSADTLIISSSDANITITAATTPDTLTFDFADSPSFTNITASGDLAVNGGDITTTNTTATIFNATATTLNIGSAATAVALGGSSGTLTIGNATMTGTNMTTFNMNGSTPSIVSSQTGTGNLFNTNLTTLNIGGAATAVNIGATSGTTTVRNNLTVTGDLTVSGTTTLIDTTNLSVEDKFIILAHGSGSISPIQEGGIIIEGSTVDSGQAFVFNSGSTADVTGRWGIAANVHATSSDVTPTEFMVSATSSGVAPSTAPTYGGSNGGYGNIHVNSADQSIWIYS
jgi:hypothetical protein